MKSSPIPYLFRKAWHYSAENRHKIGIAWSMFLVANTISMYFGPLLWSKIMDVVQTQGVNQTNFKTLAMLLGLTLATDMAYWTFHGPARYKERKYGFLMRANHLSYLVNGVLRLPMEWHVNNHTGETADKIKNGYSALQDFAANVYIPATVFVQLVISALMLSVLGGWPVALVLATCMTVAIWILNKFDQVMIGYYREINHSENQISKRVIDTISNISTIIPLRIESRLSASIMKQVRRPFELYLREFKWNEYKWFAVSMCSSATAALVTLVYLRQHMNQGILAGNLLLVIQYLHKFTSLFSHFADNYSDIVRFQTRVENSEELSVNFKTITDPVEVLPPDWQKLCVEHLTFSYHTEEGKDVHLDDVSFCVRRGQKIALIGESGSGKSTTLNVMADVYHPRDLKMTVDDKVFGHGFRGIKSNFTLVPQKPQIFDWTVIENITLGADWPLEVVRHYTDMACLTKVIDALPHGFESHIKEKGVNLSEGQAQRLALARGLLACRDKSIILLDEPTSSIDSITEMRIHENIFREFKDQTIIASVHKLNLLAFFNYIIMFDGGRIVASGTFEQLLTESPQFQNLWWEYYKHHRRTEDLT